MAEPDPRGRRRAQGALETQVLAALHTAGQPVTAGWVRERLPADLAYTTVMTVLVRLLAKDAVTRRREGRSFVWTPAADEADLAALRMRRVLDGERNRRAVLASFITTLPEDDERLLRELLGETAEGETDAAPGTGTAPDTDAAPDADASPGTGAAPGPAPAPGTDVTPGSDFGTGSGAAPAPDPDTDPDTEAAPDPDTDPDTEAAPGPDPDPDGEG